MRNLSRALHDALRYWRTLLVATLLSVGVAALWGGNIGALFPVIKVTLAGESLQQWLARDIRDSEQKVDQWQKQIDQLKQRLATATPAETKSLNLKINQIVMQQNSERAAIGSSKRFQPYVRYLPNDPFQTVALVIMFLIISTAVKHVFLLGNTMLVAHVSNHVARNIRMRIFDKAMEMDRAGFLGYGTSGFTAQITYNTDMLSNGIMSLIGGAVREPLKILSCLIGACLISWRLLVLSLIVAPVVVFLIVWLNRRVKLVCRRMFEKAAGLHHVMLEAFNSIQTVQAYSMEDVEKKRFGGATMDMLKISMKTVFYNALTRPITELLGIGMVGTTIVVGAYLVLYQETHIFGFRITDRPLGISSMLVFFGLLIGASDPVRKLSGVFSGINMGTVAADILYQILDRPTLIQSPARPKTVGRPHEVLELRDLSFAYRDNEFVLRDINIHIPFGSKIALIGPNGSGKSSLVHLICRFYDPQQGAICLDGVDLRQMALKDLRSRIGLVTQQTELFNESILYNIRYGSVDSTDEQIVAAAKLAHAHEFIMTFPEQYESLVGQSGQRLSGGQRQRIALARAILKDPEVLILDEATSQIDAESEQLINDVLTEFSRGRTLIMITHRASNLHLADRVLQLDHGRIVDRADRKQRVA